MIGKFKWVYYVVFVVLLFCGCTEKNNEECNISTTMDGSTITFENVSGENKIFKIAFSKYDSNTKKYEFTESNLRKRNEHSYNLEISEELRLIVMSGCVITINDSIVKKISDIKVGEVTRSTMFRKIKMCELVEYKLNDSIIKGRSSIIIPF